MQYQKEDMHKNPFSYRHFTIYIHAMELARLGDTSVEAYNRFMGLFKANLAEMLPDAEGRDGLGLEDRLADKGGAVNQMASSMAAEVVNNSGQYAGSKAG